jgi:hypothetical protein
MRQREAPSGFMPHPSAASGRTPAGGARHGPRKLLAVITRGTADAALKASSRGTKKRERKDDGGGCETRGRDAAVTESTLPVSARH